jgi:thiamine biosynthesis lipoprotein
MQQMGARLGSVGGDEATFRAGALVFRALGSDVRVLVDGDRREATALAACAPPWFRAWHARFDPMSPTSELRRLVQAAGAPFRASFALFELVRAASEVRARGVLGPLAPEVPAVPSVRGIARLVSKLERQSSPVLVAADVVLDAANRTLVVPRGRTLDVAPLVSAWAADRAAARLSPLRATRVDVGDATALSGPRSGGEPWRVSVPDPFAPTRSLVDLRVASGGVATAIAEGHADALASTGVHRRGDAPGEGAPVSLVAAVVVGPSALEAAAAARAVLRLGADAGLAWLDGQPGFAGLVVRAEGVADASRGLAAHLAPRAAVDDVA